MELSADRRIPGDWFDRPVPAGVVLEGEAYLETAFSFYCYRGRETAAVRIGHAAHVYMGTMFDVGPRGRVSIGKFSVLTGVRLVCDAAIEIGDYATISWNVVFMDSYRVPIDARERRACLERAARDPQRIVSDEREPARPIVLESNVWVGFDACVLPGVTIGCGSVVGARSVVTQDVPPYTIVAGNPARAIRGLDPSDRVPGFYEGIAELHR
jgi:acetyltransferase-like isoleucine patch superfamily enzyme